MELIKKKNWSQLFIIYTRYLIGSAFVFASIVKIKGERFTAESGALEPINSAWHFFEVMYESGIYWQFIGIAQLIAGGLLMTQRYAKLGAVINFPIILNIFLITISYEFKGTPVITGLMLLANITLLIWHWDELKIFLNYKPELSNEFRMEHDPIWTIFGVLLFLFIALHRVLVPLSGLWVWFILGSTLSITGLLLGLARERKRRTIKASLER